MTYWSGEFLVNDLLYHITCSIEKGFINPDDPKKDIFLWELSFGLVSDGFSGTKVIGTRGREIEIFSTVIHALKEFMRSVHPEFVAISASKENENRFPLYQRMIRREAEFITALGYNRISPLKYRYIDVHKYFDTINFRLKAPSLSEATATGSRTRACRRFQPHPSRLSVCDRAVTSVRRGRRLWHKYAPYNPELLEKMLTIYRCWQNYVWKDERNKKSAAQKLGLAVGAIRLQDILYF